MEFILGAVGLIFLLWLFFEFPATIVTVVLVVFFMKACSDDEISVKLVDPTPETSDTNHRILNPDGTPVRPSNDQIGYYDNIKQPPIKDSVEEQCIDGILYLFVTKNGKDFMAPKEDTFGYNEKCSD